MALYETLWTVAEVKAAQEKLAAEAGMTLAEANERILAGEFRGTIFRTKLAALEWLLQGGLKHEIPEAQEP